MLPKTLLVLSLAAMGLAGCNAHTASPPQSREKETTPVAGEIGSRLPDFSVKDLQGREISSANLRGKVVLIDFWATWCQPCKKEMPGYQKLLDRYGPQGFVVIGFKFDTMQDTEDPVRFARKIGVHYPLAIASDDVKLKFGGIEGLPTTMLYDRQGILRKKIIGFEYTDAFEKDLNPLLWGWATYPGAARHQKRSSIMYHAQRACIREYNTNRPHSTLDYRFHAYEASACAFELFALRFQNTSARERLCQK